MKAVRAKDRINRNPERDFWPEAKKGGRDDRAPKAADWLDIFIESLGKVDFG